MRNLLIIILLSIIVFSCVEKNNNGIHPVKVYSQKVLNSDLSNQGNLICVDTLYLNSNIEFNEFFVINYQNRKIRSGFNEYRKIANNYGERGLEGIKIKNYYLNKFDIKTDVTYSSNHFSYSFFNLKSKNLYFILQTQPDYRVIWFDKQNNVTKNKLFNFLKNHYKNELIDCFEY
jgi:hypothetical protein